MANTVATDIALKIMALEKLANDLGTTKELHTWPSVTAWHIPNGTSASQCDQVWTDQRTLTATSETLDLTGSLTSRINGQSLALVEVCIIGIYNTSTTSTNLLKIGGGSNVVPIFDNSTDIITCGPSSPFLWANIVDGVTVTAATGDLLKIDAGAFTITYDVILIGRSA